jgi:hypothetical protein
VRRRRSYQVGAPGAPQVGDDAGPNTETHEDGLRRQAAGRLDRADALIRRSKKLAQVHRGTAEEAAREAITLLAEAFWYSEGTPAAEGIHRELDGLGKWTQATFGCRLLKVDGEYAHTCKVGIVHKRFGFSPEMTSTLRCSLCAEDVSDCKHLHSRLYWVTGGEWDGRPCRVCRSWQCVHKPNWLYRARCVSLVENLKLSDVAIVERPEEPLARLTSIPLSREHLSLIKNLPNGQVPVCVLCRYGCPGMTYLSGQEVP